MQGWTIEVCAVVGTNGNALIFYSWQNKIFVQVHLPFPLNPALVSMYGPHFMEKYVADENGDDGTLMVIVLNQIWEILTYNFIQIIDFQAELDLGCVPLWDGLLQVDFA